MESRLSADQPDNTPLVTVIMPIYNEVDMIVRSLGAVLDQRYPRERLEVLVVDGRSDDGTHAVLLRATYDRRVRLLDNPQRIVSAALNIGLAEARGTMIVRVDGHTVIAPNYIAACVNALVRSGADNVGGPMRQVGTTPWGRAAAAAANSPFGAGNSRFRTSTREEWVDTVYLGAYRRDVFERIGGWDEALVRNQDDELNMRLAAAGGRTLLTPAIVSTYYSRATLGGLWRQYYEYGLWKVPVLLKHPRAVQPRHLAPGLLALGLIGGALLAPFSRPVRRLWLGLLAAYGLVLAGGAMHRGGEHAGHAAQVPMNGGSSPPTTVRDLGPLDRENQPRPAKREAMLEAWRLPPVLACMHLGYGCGFLVGILKALVAGKAFCPQPVP